MARQDYRRLHNEEDGEDIPSLASRYWKLALIVKHSVVNVTVLSLGILLGVILTTSRSSNMGDHYLQYSMVPCKYIRAS